jgi:Mg2+-importing ATPase
MAGTIVEPSVETSFDRGIAEFTWLMIRFILVMVPVVFLINGLTKGNWSEAFFFATAVAVGMTPEMLPMIVAVCLVSRGGVDGREASYREATERHSKSRRDGCADARTRRARSLKIVSFSSVIAMWYSEDDEQVLALAYLNSHFQTGLRNLMDRAILDHVHLHEQLNVPAHEKVDEYRSTSHARLCRSS